MIRSRPLPPQLLYGATVAIWGSSWLAMTFQLGVVPEPFSITYRFVLAAALLWAFCLASGRSLRFSLRDHAFMAAQGLCLFSLNYQLFYVAAGKLASGLLAVAFSTILIMNIANGAILFRHRVDRRVALAGLCGITGLGLLFWPEIAKAGVTREALLGLGLSLLATYLASLGNMISVRHKMAAIPVIESNTIGMAYGAGFSLVYALASRAPLAFDWSAGYLVSLAYLALFASVLGFGSYLTLVQRIGADRAAYTTVMFPLVALTLSTVFESYQWTIPAVAGVALVLFGNLLVLVKVRPTARIEQAEKEITPS
jgi:drug/metabolite transporter (DMT)-like permease